MVVLLLENITPGMKYLASVKESDEKEAEALIYDCQVGQSLFIAVGDRFEDQSIRKSGISRPNPKP